MSRPKAEARTVTTILLDEDVLGMLRELALVRARLQGGRVSQAAVVRDLVREAHDEHFPKGARRAS